MTSSNSSPCIGICSTVYGDNICRGCKRDYREVIHWNRYTIPEKQAVLQRLQQQIETVMAEFISIEDAARLKAQLDQVSNRPLLYQSPLCWAYELLRLKAREIQDLGAYGIRAKPVYSSLSANGLFTRIDDRLYALSQTA